VLVEERLPTIEDDRWCLSNLSITHENRDRRVSTPFPLTQTFDVTA
jgi:hypothetical protein